MVSGLRAISLARQETKKDTIVKRISPGGWCDIPSLWKALDAGHNMLEVGQQTGHKPETFEPRQNPGGLCERHRQGDGGPDRETTWRSPNCAGRGRCKGGLEQWQFESE